MNYIKLSSALTVLIESVTSISAKELLKRCRDLGMNEQPYRDLGYDSNLPDFDKGYFLNFKTDDNKIATFEILEKEDMILQAGFQIIYKSKFFSLKLKKHYKNLLKLLERTYGIGFPSKVAYSELMNFEDDKIVCYLSKMKLPGGIKSLTLRVGNKRFWS